MTLEPIFELLWPPRCPSCACLVGLSRPFCQLCIQSLLPLSDSQAGTIWPREALPIPEESALFGKVGVVSLFAYGGSIKDAILRLKHGKQVAIARPLGILLGESLRAGLGNQLSDVLICPVPLHPRRLRSRGFNQALELIRHARSPFPRKGRPQLVRDLLRRIKPTPPLGHASRADRQHAVCGAFAIRQRSLCAGKKVILVDDVMTTGATTMECAKILLEAGASQIRIFTVARAIPTFIP
jgi:ComF family protein